MANVSINVASVVPLWFNPRNDNPGIRATKGVFILITGVSGSGKTTYGRYLERVHRFHFVETDLHEAFTVEADILNRGLVERYLGRHDRVAVEWGFYPRVYKDHVLALKKQGAKLLWFTCDPEIALKNYLSAGKPRALWSRQIARIKAAKLPTEEFQRVETYRGRAPRPFEELDKEIFHERESVSGSRDG